MSTPEEDDRLRARYAEIRAAIKRPREPELIPPSDADFDDSLAKLRESILNSGSRKPESIDVGDEPYDWADEDEWYIAAINHAFRDD